MKSCPPIVSVLEAPLEHGDLNPRVLRNSHVIPQSGQIIADAPYSGFEVLGLVFIVMTSENVEVLSGKVDHLLAPDHVVRALLPACHDPRFRSNGPQLAAININDL